MRVHRTPWSVEGGRGEAIGSAYRAALELARARMGGRGWIVEVQANEVFHECSYEILRELPDIHRGKVEFLLPYYSLHGTYLVEVLWRLRYMHASREIAIYSDAVALNSRERLGPSRLLRILARELWKSYVRPANSIRSGASQLFLSAAPTREGVRAGENSANTITIIIIGVKLAQKRQYP